MDKILFLTLRTIARISVEPPKEVIDNLVEEEGVLVAAIVMEQTLKALGQPVRVEAAQQPATPERKLDPTLN